MKRKNKSLVEIAGLLKSTDEVALVSHSNTDGDALSSMLALAVSLRSIGKKAYVCIEEDLSDNLTFLTDLMDIRIQKEIPEVGNVILVDVSVFSRAQFYSEIDKLKVKGSKIFVLDHHRGGDENTTSDYYFVDEKAASCTEIINDLIIEMGISIDEKLATCLLTGIESDTSSFTNQNTTARTLSLASELVEKGAQMKFILENIFWNSTISELKVRGLVYERLYLNEKYGMAISYLTHEDLLKYNLTVSSGSGFANMLNTMKGVNILFFVVEEEPGKLKVSTRTRGDVDLSKFAKKFGGGGHKGAAGFTLDGVFDIVNGKVLIKDVDKSLVD